MFSLTSFATDDFTISFRYGMCGKRGEVWSVRELGARRGAGAAGARPRARAAAGRGRARAAALDRAAPHTQQVHRATRPRNYLIYLSHFCFKFLKLAYY